MESSFTNHDLVSGAIDILVRPILDQIIRTKGKYAGQRQGDVFNFKTTSSELGLEIGAEIEGPTWGVWRGNEEYFNFFMRGIFQRNEINPMWHKLDELGLVALSGIVESLREIAEE